MKAPPSAFETVAACVGLLLLWTVTVNVAGSLLLN